MKTRIETPIAFGLTLTVCLVLLFYCWRIRKLRNRLTGSVQVSALPMIAESTTVLPAEEQTGIKKEVIASFPTVKAHELLKDDIKEGCPICLVEYADAEVLRKLPLCGHVFHTRCVDSWLENQVTCPVCRIVLTGAVLSKVALRRRSAATNANSVTVEVPGWVLVNRPVPLPPAIADNQSPPPLPSSSSGSSEPAYDSLGVSPLLERHNTAGWGAVYLESIHPHGLSFRTTKSQLLSDTTAMIQTKECVHHASISERWMTESFVFGISSCDDGGSQDSVKPMSWLSLSDSSQRHASWNSRSVNSEVFEARVTPFRPLTMSPERCSFEFLPIVTAPRAGDYSSRSPRPWVGPSPHVTNLYSHL